MSFAVRRLAVVAVAVASLAACGGSPEDTTPAPQCTAASQCSGTDTGCRTRTCVAGTCGFSFADPTTVASTQTAGDCHQNRCDGSGGVVAVVDDGDVPADDGSSCTSESCSGGVPVHPPVAANTACAQGGGAYCDGAGACVECTAASQCGSDTECRVHTCVAGACGVSDQPSGTTVSTQTAGDCRSNVCDGLGAVTSVALDGDLPADDGNQCTADLCSSGAPVHPPVASGTACNQSAGAKCDGAGSCVQCFVAADCGTDTACKTFTCNAGVCGSTNAAAGAFVANPTPGDCRSNQCDGSGNVTVNAVDDTDVPADDGSQCTLDVCSGGSPSHPPSPLGTPCTQGGGATCSGAGACVLRPALSASSPTGASVVTPTEVSLTFNVAMDPVSLVAQTAPGACTGSIQLSADDFVTCAAFASATPTMSAGNTVASLSPAPALLVNRTYKLRTTTAATSAAGVPLAATATTVGFSTGITPSRFGVVLHELYSGAAFALVDHDYVVLHNLGLSTVDLTGWSLQVAQPLDTVWSGNALGGAIPPGGYFLVQMGLTAGSGAPLPTPDASGAVKIHMSSGKVALVSTTTALSGACPTGPEIVDFLGYGTANCWSSPGTGPAPQSFYYDWLHRPGTGCLDSGNDATDFVVETGPADPKSSAAAPLVCSPLEPRRTLNESGVQGEADFCVLLDPAAVTIQAGTPMPLATGRIFEPSVTEAAGPSALVTAQLGFGPEGANPEVEPGWTWVPATFAGQVGSDDEYQASFAAPAPGTYRYGYRFSLDGGNSWTYCDLDGAGSNSGLTFDLDRLGILTVTP